MSSVKSERHARILGELVTTPSLRIAELAQKLSVSTETIRRDLDDLTQQGLLDRTYGGAIRRLSAEPPVQERHALFIAERARIAAAALPLIAPAKMLMIGSGATTTHVAHAIAAAMKDITVIAHSFAVARALSVNRRIKILMLPGDYNADEDTMLGGHTVGFLNKLHADFAILGASGLSDDGPSDALLETGAVYSAMIARAARTMIVADHSKFALLYPANYSSWRQIGDLVTDRQPQGSLRASLIENGVAITHPEN